MAKKLPGSINGEAVLHARLRKGWTQREVAQRCAELGQPYDDTQISKIERGKIDRPTPLRLRALALALDLDITDLLTPGCNGKDGAA
jgi:transcriptional regulator with XRE-family HTH domain